MNNRFDSVTSFCLPGNTDKVFKTAIFEYFILKGCEKLTLNFPFLQGFFGIFRQADLSVPQSSLDRLSSVFEKVAGSKKFVMVSIKFQSLVSIDFMKLRLLIFFLLS